jgi:hypothetical protein
MILAQMQGTLAPATIAVNVVVSENVNRYITALTPEAVQAMVEETRREEALLAVARMLPPKPPTITVVAEHKKLNGHGGSS